MERLVINYINIENFKGIERFNWKAEDTNNWILKQGANGIGKTSILDAISYVLNNKKRYDGSLAKNINRIDENGVERQALIFLELKVLTNNEITGTFVFLLKKNEWIICINDEVYKYEVGDNGFFVKVQNLINMYDQDYKALCTPVAFLAAQPKEQLYYFINSYFKTSDFKDSYKNFLNEKLKYNQYSEFFKDTSELLIADTYKATYDTYNKLLKEAKKRLEFFNNLINNYQELIAREKVSKQEESKVIIAYAQEMIKTIKQSQHPLAQKQVDKYTIALLFINIFQYRIAKEINKLIKEHSFNFEIQIASDDKGEKVIIKKDNIEFKNLNRAQRQIIAIELSLFFQKIQSNYSFILLDDLEMFSIESREKINKDIKINRKLTLYHLGILLRWFSI
ncbi:hypothetical protein ACR82Z_04710 [Mycoplasma sp. 6243]|uniref:hypothetical protein n=1 Tax=Mycoplasma sp. 6243 TaxID=3440865 RepID=UPI003EB7A28E